mmetsp:Transcript_23254/g.58154  ORF Transcript_23254/g.58154 Transcript_23254/m.58154 type:complete len:405 (+) Transcript_23254:279-1493(+)
MFENISHLLSNCNHFLMPRHVCHSKLISWTTTECYTLQLDKIRCSTTDQSAIVRDLISIPTLDESKTEHSALFLLPQVIDTGQETLPEVLEERPIDLLHGFGVARIHTQVELCDWLEVSDLLGELGVGHQEGGDALAVQQIQELVDLGIHDRFADQRERTVLHVKALLEASRDHSGHSFHLLDHLSVLCESTFKDHVGFVHLPFPLLADRVLVVTPAEHAGVRTRQTRCGFHALVRVDSIECAFVALATTTQRGLGPTTHLHTTVRADDLVALLGECALLSCRDHLRKASTSHRFGIRFGRLIDRSSQVFDVQQRFTLVFALVAFVVQECALILIIFVLCSNHRCIVGEKTTFALLTLPKVLLPLDESRVRVILVVSLTSTEDAQSTHTREGTIQFFARNLVTF